MYKYSVLGQKVNKYTEIKKEDGQYDYPLLCF